jgi:hypothetical protein
VTDGRARDGQRDENAPIVLVPIGADEVALDACLAALDIATSAGTRIWLIDDAQAGPRGQAIIQRWLQRTPLSADYSRRQRSAGEVPHLDQALSACGPADVVVLAATAMPAPGWLTQLTACLARDPSIATATPWSNAGETAAWPRCGEIAPLPNDMDRVARACASLAPMHPELPAAVPHAVALRGRARQRVGGLDGASYGSWSAALTDLSLRLSGLGWRNALCETAFVARANESTPGDGDLDLLAARWPAWHARLAGFLMNDPLHALRAQLAEACERAAPAAQQQELFA